MIVDKVACANCCDAVPAERIALRSPYCSVACVQAVKAWAKREAWKRRCVDCRKPKISTALRCDKCRLELNAEYRAKQAIRRARRAA